MGRSLAGAVAIVTGASDGIGRATALALAAAGANVAAIARRERELGELRARAVTPDLIAPIVADLTEAGAPQAVVATTVERFGRLDILVNNAGRMVVGEALTTDARDLTSMVDLNLLAVMHACTAALPHLVRAAGDGLRGVADVVNVGSLSGRAPTRRRSGYAATKAGVAAFTEALRQEVGERGVRVALVEPGLTTTGLRSHESAASLRAMERDMPGLSGVRPLVPERVADAIGFIVCQPAEASVSQLVVRPTAQQA